jgi:outer membrane receptor protein involved in Fe transport
MKHIFQSKITGNTIMLNSRLSRMAAAVAMAVGISTSAFAQETSGGVRGTITDPSGSPAANVSVVITHLPSGTKRTVTTNDSGNYQVRGLRVGGPYKVTFDSDTYRDQDFEGLFLQLGEVERISAQLESEDVERIVVTSSAPAFSNSAGSSYFGEDAIAGQAGLTRDIKDVIRANPLVSLGTGADREISIAGNNPRFNSITVDGISQNDNFGLNGGGFPTQRTPFPLDALDQITVDVVPFDVKQGGFSGGLVNAVFKSGTNEFHGSAFYEQISDSLAGTPRGVNGNDIDLDFTEDTYGFSVGGPIIKDKLFFFVSYQFLDIEPVVEFGPAGGGAPNDTLVTSAEAQQVIDIARSVYGLTDEQIGGVGISPTEEDESLVAKLDWNINDFHRASFTYQFNEGNRTSNLTNNVNELRLSSHAFNESDELNNFSVKLYSDWTDSFSTEIAFNIQDVDNGQVSFSEIADVEIENLPSGGDLSFGSDQFRHANQLDTKNTIFRVDAQYLYDTHNIEFGFEYQSLDITNIFLPGSRGVIVFDGLENFANQFAESYEYQNGLGNDPAVATADFTTDTLALFVQDSWDITDRFTLNAGLRYERISTSDRPLNNPNSLARTGLDNTATLDGVDILLPRIGFNYEVNDVTTLRGGVGRFSGGQPNVWISNAFTNPGVNVAEFEAEGITITPGSIAGILPDALAAIPNTVEENLAAGNEGDVNLIDPDFQLPNDIRYQLAVDYIFDIPGLGDNFIWTNEFIHINRNQAPAWVDASLPGISQSPTSEGSVVLANDGRQLFIDDENVRDLLLTNSDGGRSNIFSTSLSKSWDSGWDVNLAYTNQDITEGNQGTSSTANSNFRFSPQINRNEPFIGTGAFETEHRLVATVGYSTEFFAGYETNFNLFFERRSGNPVSFTTNFGGGFTAFGSSAFGGAALSPGTFGGTYLAYIPTPGDNTFVIDPDAGFTEADLFASIEAAGLSEFGGQFVPRGSANAPYINTLDLSITQEVPGFVKGHKGKVTLIIDNLLNLIDSSQGRVFDSQFDTLRLYDVNGIDAQGRFIIDQLRDDPFRFDADDSTWRIKVGVSYAF